MSPIVIAALYKFVNLSDYKDLRDPLLRECKRLGIKGSLLLAEEGINGTISGERGSIDRIRSYLLMDPRFADLEYKESWADDHPFYRMKVLFKKEIVTLGVPGTDPHKKVGTYLAPNEWNALIQDPHVVVLDTRNDYEYQIGTFKGARDPNIRTFREFPMYVAKNLDPKEHTLVALFCTGGIRCEKASSYMLEQGFKEVYHLKGGILKYLEDIPKEESLWEGACFVFDHRTSVTHGLDVGDFDTCYGCRWPVSKEDKHSPYYREGVHCSHCYGTMSPKKMAAAASRQRQVELAKKRRIKHIGER